MIKRYVLIFLIVPISCGITHYKKVVVLDNRPFHREVIYLTENADFYIQYDALKNYCLKKDNGEPNDFQYRQVIDYITNYNKNPVFVSDTLGTKLSNETLLTKSDSLMRVRDLKHPYSFVTSRIRWIILEMAEKGKVKIFDKKANLFVGKIIIQEIDTRIYGVTNIALPNNSIIYSQLRWMK